MTKNAIFPGASLLPVRTIRGRLFLVACISALFLAAFGSAEGRETEEAKPEPGFQTLPPSAHPVLGGFSGVPAHTRVWAQLAEDDAFLTTAQDVLPGTRTPIGTGGGPQVVFRVFDALDVVDETDYRQYHASVGRAAWDAEMDDALESRASWRLSASTEQVDVLHGAAPRLLVEARLVAVGEDGERRLLAAGSRHVDLFSLDGSPTRVDMSLGRGHRDIAKGDRLLMELDWSWLDGSDGDPLVRPPLVTLHPGSWVDLPIKEPLRIHSFQERQVLDRVYVQAEVAHLFSVRNLDIRGTMLTFHGSGPDGKAGRALVRGVDDDGERDHRAVFDWMLPYSSALLREGEHRLWLTLRQVGDPGPRIVGVRLMALAPQEVVTPVVEPDVSPYVGIAAAAGLGAMSTFGVLAYLRARPRRHMLRVG